ncbi:transposase [Paraburkholderia bryophila]|jgi:transposase|uniref:transposase n=1 Tax=Paraburkholderia bryophila TaxID=420952 RepID=UPI000DD0072E
MTVEKGSASRVPLSDDDWARVAHLFHDSTEVRRGRPTRSDRNVLNAILWILETGESWSQLPHIYSPMQTCYNKWLIWRKNGVLAQVFQILDIEGID